MGMNTNLEFMLAFWEENKALTARKCVDCIIL